MYQLQPGFEDSKKKRERTPGDSWLHAHHDPTTQRLVHAPPLFPGHSSSNTSFGVKSPDMSRSSFAAAGSALPMSIAPSRSSFTSLGTGDITHGGWAASDVEFVLRTSGMAPDDDAHSVREGPREQLTGQKEGRKSEKRGVGGVR